MPEQNIPQHIIDAANEWEAYIQSLANGTPTAQPPVVRARYIDAATLDDMADQAAVYQPVGLYRRVDTPTTEPPRPIFVFSPRFFRLGRDCSIGALPGADYPGDSDIPSNNDPDAANANCHVAVDAAPFQ